MARKPLKTDQCLNCEHPLNGDNFCPNCGQKNDNRKLSLFYVIRESLGNLFAFDGRFFVTLKNLFLHPGKVAAEYVEGKRMRYMNPVRIYFLSSLLLLSLAQLQREPQVFTMEPGETVVEEADSTEEESTGIPIELSVNGEDQVGFLDKVEIMSEYYEEHKDMKPEHALDSLNFSNNAYHRFLYTQGIKTANFDQEDFNRYLYSKMFWVLFLFLPILALLLKILYIRRGFYYTEHLFFAFYTQSVFFILFSITNLLGEVGSAIATVLIFIGFAVYLYYAMKRFYDQGSGKTLLKLFLLNLMVFPTFFVFLIVATFAVFVLF